MQDFLIIHIGQLEEYFSKHQLQREVEKKKNYDKKLIKMHSITPRQV